jgi:hypothetical protein
MMQQLFTPEAANVTYLGVVLYKNKRYIIETTVCVFQHLQEATCFWIEAMAMEKLMSAIYWASEVIDDGVNGYLVHPTAAYANRV